MNQKYNLEERRQAVLMDLKSRLKAEEFSRLLMEIQFVIPQDREPFMVDKRMEAVVKLRDKYNIAYKDIGRIIYRDHSSVVHLIRKAKVVRNQNK